ncbi:MAG TPA: TIGR02270 family protein [Ideonella sp.]|uniref:TIGR02270 family protein n=1 Tax=Ideonella sp. TaxID=1929293 RepID=UPI002E3049C3|nr:TIGR02270 family protein [Ideonella sp.]HEX5686598.1 TIGR02270 family protein [Ideonella sp.]
MNQPRVIPSILEQHCEEASFLATLRTSYLARADVSLDDLDDLDERIEAHLDGIRTTQQRGWLACREALGNAGSGEIFTAVTLALEANTAERLSPLLAVVEAEPSLWSGLVGAFNWASPQDLKGTVKALLGSDSPFHCLVGLSSCLEHRVDPGPLLGAWCRSADPRLSMVALRAVGELGVVSLRARCEELLHAPQDHRTFWAARSAVLTGDRMHAVDLLAQMGLNTSLPLNMRRQAIEIALQAMDLSKGHALLRRMHDECVDQRLIIQSVGILGCPRYAGWLIERMNDACLARVAGEAFELVTGADTRAMQLPRDDRPIADDCVGDASADVEVAMREDASLPWLDPAKIAAWWDSQGSRLSDQGRYLRGEVPTVERCFAILKIGSQRHRRIAAQVLCLLQPGSVLFNTSAPAWRQRRLLEAASPR